MAKKKRTKKQKQRNKIIVFILEILLLIVVIAGLMVFMKLKDLYSKIDTSEPMNETEAGINTEIDSGHIEEMKGYTNIALFGLDNRSSGNYDSGRSDTIMIASINNKTKEVKLVSVYRDTYLSVGGGDYKKANTAFAKGGVTQAIQMLNGNLDMDITQYVCVDWTALVEAIDALGGVTIDITKQEMDLINSYTWEIDDTTGNKTKPLKKYGKVVLNGTQATSYARIRKTSGDDFRRASRQRIVIQAMLDEAKKADIPTLLGICEAVFDDISTNLTLPEILNLAKDVASYSIGSTTGFPFDLTTRRLSGSGDSVIPISLSNNVSQLHQYLFGVSGYKPTGSVNAISDSIMDKTGVDENTKPINMDKYNETVGQDGSIFD